MKRIVVFSLLVLVLFVIGCSNEDTSPISPELSNQSLTLVIAKDNDGQVRVSSPNGQLYTEGSLQETIKVAAQNAQVFETKIVAQPFRDNSKSEVLVATAPPRSSLVRTFISDVTSVRDGIAVTLTDVGLGLGLTWQGAWTLACYTMFEYELQNPFCANWPSWYYQAIREQVRLEMYYHSIAFFYWHSPRFRTVNIVFGKLP